MFGINFSNFWKSTRKNLPLGIAETAIQDMEAAKTHYDKCKEDLKAAEERYFSNESLPVGQAMKNLHKAQEEFEASRKNLIDQLEEVKAQGTFWDRHGTKVRFLVFAIGCTVIGAAAANATKDSPPAVSTKK